MIPGEATKNFSQGSATSNTSNDYWGLGVTAVAPRHVSSFYRKQGSPSFVPQPPRGVFDPGIRSSSPGVSPLNPDVLNAAFNAFLPNAKNMTLMHREGVAIVGSCERFLPRVLFDTGALSSSYVSSQWVDENRDILQDLLVPVTSRVSLADNVTVVPINHVINLTLSSLLIVRW